MSPVCLLKNLAPLMKCIFATSEDTKLGPSWNPLSIYLCLFSTMSCHMDMPLASPQPPSERHHAAVTYLNPSLADEATGIDIHSSWVWFCVYANYQAHDCTGLLTRVSSHTERRERATTDGSQSKSCGSESTP